MLKKSIIVVALASLAASVQAGLTTYPSLPALDSAVSSVATFQIPEPLDGYLEYFGNGTASVTYNDVNFSTSSSLGNGAFINVGTGFSGDPPVLSSQEGTFGIRNILITFPSAVTAFALNYETFDGSSVTFSLGNGDTFTQGSTGTGIASYAARDFAGASDSTPFTSVLVMSTDPVLNIGNVGNVPDAGTFSLDVFLAVPFGLQALRSMRVRNQSK
jgi:hypothetical protein